MKMGQCTVEVRRVPSMVGIAALLACVQLPVEGTPAPAPSPERYIVVLRSDLLGNEVPERSRQIVRTLAPTVPSLRIERRGPSASQGAAGSEMIYSHALKGLVIGLREDDRGGLEHLRRHPDVAFISEDRALELHTQQTQPGMERIRVRGNRTAAVNDSFDTNVDVDIAVLDTGIDGTHPDLNLYRSASFVSGDTTLDDPHGHGTHVAGIAAAIDDETGIHGVAPGARLWSVKVVDAFGVARVSDLLSGLDYVAAHAGEIDVVNMSLGGFGVGDDGNCGAVSGDALHLAICNIVDAGVVVVASAGNFEPYGQDASLISPASYDEVITVSAVIETDGLDPGAGQGVGTGFGADNSFARTFSNYGWDVDIAAPGVHVLSTWPGGGYASQTGTSMAAAHVSGAAALWIAKNGKPIDRQGADHVKRELVRLGFPQRGPDVGFVGDKETFAEPLLNVAALDPGTFDPVEPELITDRSVYEYGVDTEAVVSVHLKDQTGAPLGGIPSNGFRAYLSGQQQPVQFEELGQGIYRLTLDIAGLLPGDYDFTARVRGLAGFERSAGCRILIQVPTPSILVRELTFLWPVMNQDFFFSSNPLQASLMNEKGAPLAVPTDALQSTFSADGAELGWSLPEPDLLNGVNTGITYGAYQSSVADIHLLPLGTHYVDLAVSHEGLTASATASFEIAYNDPALAAELSTNLSRFDFTQTIEPPTLDLRVDVTSEWLTGVTGLFYLLADPLELWIDGQARTGVAFSEDPARPGSYLARDVDLGSLAHGQHALVVRVTDSRGLSTDSNAVVIDVVRETGPCAYPAPGAGQTDTDGDGIRDECDNCPTVSNRSQRNTSSADPSETLRGDACKAFASLRVSSNALDNPDFSSIQEAVDAAVASPKGVQIEILAGSAPYAETIVVDRDQTFRFIGRDGPSGPPVLELDSPGARLFEIRSSGTLPTQIRNLVLRGAGSSSGQTGIFVDAAAASELADLRFEQLANGIDIRAGDHLVHRIFSDETVGTGVRLGDGLLTLRHGEFRGVDRAVEVFGAAARATVENTLIVGNGSTSGVTNDASPTAMLDLRYSTLVGCATAVSGNDGLTAISHSILWNNGSDISGVPCTDVSWSDLQSVDCGGTNLSVDPLFVDPGSGDFRLQAGSPLLDHGPDPTDYSGLPCVDLDGRPRLLDHDGEDLAQVDPGAYERRNNAAGPPEVTGLIWTAPDTLEWNPDANAAEFHVYRAELSSLSYAALGTLRDDLDPARNDTWLIDPEQPPPGGGFYYEVSLEDAGGEESTLGVGTCAERSNRTRTTP